MTSFSRIVRLSCFGAAVTWFAAPALAVGIPDGTVSISALYNPTVDLASDPATYKATSGATFQISGSGGFGSVSGLTGTMNGTLSFSGIVGTILPQTLANFFVFNDGVGGTYNFSVDSVTTKTMALGSSSSMSLYLLGNTIDVLQGYSATATSLTLSFNSTGGSPYSASATLAVPPSPTPEPASWAMMVGGFGVAGLAIRRKRRATSAALPAL